MSQADVIVVGLGAVGAATAYQLAKRGTSLLGLDRFHPPHNQGSSHGETRITRRGIGEGEAYASLALRSHEIWRELEANTGRSLLLACGVLILGPNGGQTPHHGKTDFVRRSASTAARFAISHEVLGASEVAHRYPQLGLSGDEVAYFEPGGGLVYPERCIEAQLSEARRLGAQLAYGERVVSIEPTSHGVRVVTRSAQHEARRVILSSGAWTAGLVGPALARVALQPQALHWCAADDPSAYAPDRFPTFIWMHGDAPNDLFYGFPIPPDTPTQAVKVATESFLAIDDPDKLNRIVSAQLQADIFERHVKGRLRGVGPRVVRSAACLYAQTPDADFVIDAHPNSDRILIASACSGHGFKHSAAVGELLAQIVLEAAPRPEAFRLDRPPLISA